MGRPASICGEDGDAVVWSSRLCSAQSVPNQSLQQTGAAVRLSEVFCLLRGPGC